MVLILYLDLEVGRVSKKVILGDKEELEGI